MLALFTKSREAIAAYDLEEVVGWPEGPTLEFKNSLPERDGRDSPWLGGGNISTYTKEKLFKEVVAFANSQGGHLLLGVEESDADPRVAMAIRPVPRCADLARRLEQSASDCIDPPIPMLQIVAIPVDVQGNGIIVFRVPPSRSGPHRAPDKECYVRRGSSSEPLTMREVHDLTLLMSRRIDEVNNRFSIEAERFMDWFKSAPVGDVWGIRGFRITAVPVGAVLNLERVYRQPNLVHQHDRFVANLSGVQVEYVAVHCPTDERPILRGSRRAFASPELPTFLDIFRDGTLNLGFRLNEQEERDRSLYVGWVLAHATNVLLTADAVRSAAGAPDCEYGIEIELHAILGPPLCHAGLPIIAFGRFRESIGTIRSTPCRLPRLSLGARNEIPRLIEIVYRDIVDACEARYAEPPSFIVQIPDMV